MYLKSEENDIFEIRTQICQEYAKIEDSGYIEEF
jgi:hypothetical protein